ncbi:hypothetical protein DB32_007933 [Sandaracinus amylolyticus]|uniref:Uncharacterized protein n=1 Tax=Sandaracinus amylolyticus TaxID=927083 RepID=A0A0F6SHP1_9BACT|nr:hypothetical protein DB32_007933 [Sandaracinus amylolyticus]
MAASRARDRRAPLLGDPVSRSRVTVKLDVRLPAHTRAARPSWRDRARVFHRCARDARARRCREQ